MSQDLDIVPVTFDYACGFVEMWHRHLDPPVGHMWSTGVVTEDDVIRGVSIVGRPVAQGFQDGRTLEVLRVATDGTFNACSKLYTAAWHAAKWRGFRRLVTYTHAMVYGPVCADACRHASCRAVLMGETGASLRGAGWRIVAQRPPRRGWNTPSRPRDPGRSDGIPRTLWEAV
ncbi:XF1762 family protein [Streptosporangium sp. NPDC023963]|uniref:XF1762 family protein n=1 Tax=Streptosporangium sp. NPDC023963 TaxID=3155608 RepID=UPI003434AC6F